MADLQARDQAGDRPVVRRAPRRPTAVPPPNRYMVSKVKRAHPGRGLNNPVFFSRHIALDALLTDAAIRSGTWRRPQVRVAPNRYRWFCLRPLREGDCEGSLHAQEFDRVPSAGVSKGRLDLGGGAGRGASRLPRESIRATPRRSAQLVCFARRTGNQQFASISSEASAPFGPGHRALVQSNGRGQDLWRRRASRDQSPTSVDGLQHAPNARPLTASFSAARRGLKACLSSAPH